MSARLNRKQYTENNLIEALTAVRNGMSQRAACVTYNVPRTTLQNRLFNKVKKIVPGPDSFLSVQEELNIVEWVVSNWERGFPRRQEDIKASVKQFLDQSPRQTPFKNNIPGKKWYASFLKRHPQLVTRTTEAITDASSKISKTDIQGWFKKIRIYLESTNCSDILNDPSRIYNGDETNFLLCPKSGKVLAPKGCQIVYDIDQGQAKENLTVMFSFAANGDIIPPMIIYPYKRMPSEIINSVPSGWGIQNTDNGWMTSDVFCNYIEKLFYPALINSGIKFPVIIFLDGHKTHVTYKLSRICTDLKIILICLYPNATRILQPADVAVFKPLKDGWRNAVHNWRRENVGKPLNKVAFAPILKLVVDSNIKKQNIINGFRACGLHPFDETAIDYSKCLGRNKESDENVTGNITKEKIITLQDSKNIVGHTKYQDLVAVDYCSNINDNYSEDFVILHKLYNALITTNDENLLVLGRRKYTHWSRCRYHHSSK